MPFALVPTIKFACSHDILGEFALSKRHLYFASFMGVLLFVFNFVPIFMDGGIAVWEYIFIGVLALIYVCMIFMAIWEPTQPLKKIT